MKRAKKRSSAKPGEFVLDGSLAVAWCFPDEQASYPQAVLESLARTHSVVPSLWRLEVGNVLLLGERRQRCRLADTANWLAFLNSLPITVDDETPMWAWSNVLSLARAHNLSVYDAAYLELALHRGLALATLDDQLSAAAAAIGVAKYRPSQA